MRTTSHRGARRLLVTSGALIVGLSAFVPGSCWADVPDGRGNGPSVGLVEDRGASRVWVCQDTPSGTNPWVAIEIAENAVDPDRHLRLGDEWLGVLGARPAVRGALQLTDEEMEAIGVTCALLAAARDAAAGVGTQPVGVVPPVGVLRPVVGGHGGNPPTGVTGPSRVDPGASEPPAGVGQDGSAPPADTNRATRGVPADPAQPGQPAVPTQPAAPAAPDVPAHPVQEGGSRPGVEISTETVTRPVAPVPAVPVDLDSPAAPVAPATPVAATPAAPASGAAEISSRSETAVLGDVTTRISSTGVGAVSPGALAATGSEGTLVLAGFGGVLLLGGLALTLLGRSRTSRTA